MNLLMLLGMLACSDKMSDEDTGSIDTGDTSDTDTSDTDTSDTDTSDTDTSDTDTSDTDTSDTDTNDTGDSGQTIEAIQTGLIPVGETVTLTDVIVSSPRSNFGFFISNSTGGPNSGLWVYLNFGNSDDLELTQGETLNITGIVEEYPDSCNDNTDNDGDGLVDEDDDDCNEGQEGVLDTYQTLTELEVNSLTDIEKTGESPVLPGATVLDPAVLLDPAQAEAYEGTLVQLDNVTVTSTVGDFGEWAVDGVIVDDVFDVDPGMIGEGDIFTSVRGLLNFSYGNYKIEPRTDDDLIGWTRTCGAARCIWNLEPGEIVLTEIMINPDNDLDGDGSGDCSDTDGEYYEVIYNTTSGDAADIRGLVITDAGGDQAYISENVVLNPGEMAWVSVGDSSCYGTPNAHLGSTGLRLNNSGTEEVTLTGVDETGLSIIFDHISYDDSQVEKGVSLQLSSAALDATSNDDPLNWCPSIQAITDNVDMGTPGLANDECTQE